jgi:hypothetical protein
MLKVKKISAAKSWCWHCQGASITKTIPITVFGEEENVTEKPCGD